MAEYVILDLPGQKLVVQDLYTVEGYLTMRIMVQSDGFTGHSHFCVSKAVLADIISALESMETTLKGRAQIQDADSDSTVILEMKAHGQLELAGQIGGSHEDHYMRFRYMTDQTVLRSLIRSFRKMIAENDDPTP